MAITKAMLMDIKTRTEKFRADAAPLLVAADILEKALAAHYEKDSSQIERFAVMTDLDLLQAIRFNFRCRFCEGLLPVPRDYDDYQRCPACSAVYGFEEEGEGYDFPAQAAEMIGVAQETLDIVSSEEPFDVLLLDESQPPKQGSRVYVYFVRPKAK